ncbi:MAG: protein kinase [Rubrivivax sp.]|nr:protein kinase [Rubrivivax sp.]
MQLSAADWSTVFALLDEALDLDPSRRDAWLAVLAPERQRLQPVLRQLLDERRAIETGDFLNRLPALPPPDAAPTADFVAGHRVGPYTLLRELGTGGMAAVWLAVRADAAHRREVALKLPYLGARARVIGERFARERQILSALTHPHIASVLDAGLDGNQPWLAMEFVDGLPLAAWAERQRLNVPARLRLFLQVLTAVQYAHAQLVIHRDIKPSNVLVDGHGQVKLLDFGVAKLLGDDGATQDSELTQLGGRALTPQYASPEQVAGRPLGTASDVYSLGVLLYELLTGHLPYTLKRDSAAAVEEAILSAQVQRPSQAAADARTARSLRGDVDTLVMKALQARPEMRYASAAALAEDIERHLHSQPILARPDSLAYRLRKLWGRRRLALSAGLMVCVAVAGGTGAALWQARQARTEAVRTAAVQKFLIDIFKANSSRQSDPERARATTARELLDIGAERIGRELADQPELRLTMLDTLGELYKNLGLETKAAALARDAAQVAQRVWGTDSEEHLLRLANLANVLADAVGNAERQRTVEEGLAIAARRPDRPTPARTRLYLEAASLYQSARLDDAEAYGQRALADARALGDPSLLRRAYETSGVTAQLRGDAVRAEERLTEAVRLGEQDPSDSFDLLRARAQLADAQARRLRLDASEASLRAALAYTLRVHGPAHINTHQTRMRLAFTLARMGRLREALAEHETLQSALDAAATLDTFTFPLHASGYWQTLYRLGRHAEAVALLHKAIEVRDRTRRGTRVAAELREFLVHPLLALGRTDEAATWLQQAAAIRTANGLKPGQRVWSLHAVAAHELARARGDTAAARAALDTLVAGGDADPPDSLGWVDGTLLRARFDIDQGQLDAAQARLQRLRRLLSERQLLGRLVLVEGERLTLCGVIAGQRGAAGQAGTWLERARQTYAAELGAEAPLVRAWVAARDAVPPAGAGTAEIDCG